MLSVASLLNPVKPESRGTRLPSSPSPSLCTSSSTHGSPQLSTQSTIKKQKMTKDGAIFAKGKIKGDINFPPFQILDKETLAEVEKFQVYPLGKIDEYCRHIPYNSEKKNFLKKTGRESFEGMMTPVYKPVYDPCSFRLQFSNTSSEFLETKKTTMSCGITILDLFVSHLSSSAANTQRSVLTPWREIAVQLTNL